MNSSSSLFIVFIAGKWYSVAADSKKTNQQLVKKSNSELKSGYCFLPYASKFGAADLVITGGIYDSKDKTYLPGSSEIRIRANILNKNDRPIISKSTFVLPNPLPYKYADITGAGTEVKDILLGKTVSDVDGDEVGEFFNLYRF